MKFEIVLLDTQLVESWNHLDSIGLLDLFLADISLFRLFYTRRAVFVLKQRSMHFGPAACIQTPLGVQTVVVALISGLRGEDGPSFGLITAAFNSPLPRQHCRAPRPAPLEVVHCGSWIALRSVCTRSPFSRYDVVEVIQSMAVTSLSPTT